MKESLPQKYELYADLPGYDLNGSTIPPDIVCTGQRPDIAIIDRTSKNITLLESNTKVANVKKTTRYTDLKKDLEDKGYTTSLAPLLVGARGLIMKK